MAKKLDIIAPQIQSGSSALTMGRWLKSVGDQVFQNEPIAELYGPHAQLYAHAPATGVLSLIMIPSGQNLLTGTAIGQLSVIANDAIDWENFDQVTAILEDFTFKSKETTQLKDANEALSQLLGIGNDSKFQSLSIEQQNGFLQNVVDQYQQNGLSPAQVALKLLQGLDLRVTPVTYAPMAPGLGLRGPGAPTPGGGFGGGSVPQQHAYPSYPVQPQQGAGYPGGFDPNQYPPAGGYPQIPPQQQAPFLPPKKDDE